MAQSWKVFPNTYRDSVQLMQLSAKLQSAPGVEKVAIMMGTPANMAVLKEGGMSFPSDLTANPNDMIVCVQAQDKSIPEKLFAEIHKSLSEHTKSSGGGGGEVEAPPKTVAAGAAKLQEKAGVNPNLALISVPGRYAAAEALKALKKGMHVFLFSDNVSVQDEIMLKQYGHSQNLLVMGPDCGTASLDGVPLGFCNVIRAGPVGLVGASGTGLQQVSSLLHRLGTGVSQIIGVGGRDTTEEVDGVTMLAGFQLLAKDPNTRVIGVVSKSPSMAVEKKLFQLVKKCPKPVVINFLGAEEKDIFEAGAAPASSLEDAAVVISSILNQEDPKKTAQKSFPDPVASAAASASSASGGKVYGLYSGGTLCKDAKLILKHAQHEGAKIDFEMLDLGEDEYTVGRAHPMIDFTVRNEFILKAAEDPQTSLILMDVVLGYGAHDDPAGELVPAIKKAQAIAQKKGRKLTFVASVCGTDQDPQDLKRQEKELLDVGVLLTTSNAQAARLAVSLLTKKPVPPHTNYELPKNLAKLPPPGNDLENKILGGVAAINIGLARFADPLIAMKAPVLHLDWKPPAQGDDKLGLGLAYLADCPAPSSDSKLSNATLGSVVDAANKKAVDRFLSARPSLVSFTHAKEAVAVFKTGKTILHSGPPITWDKMCGPMQGAVIGACLFEGWAKNAEEASKLAASGQIKFAPCHEHGAVGPMAGIVSPSMAGLVVKNTTHGNTAFCSLNEGLGKVLRFGAYDEEVTSRLKWMAAELAPSLAQILKAAGGAIDLKPMLAQALQMGDECHNRVSAGTLLLLSKLLSESAGSVTLPPKVMKFLLANQHFFLNASMAACKAMLDAAHDIEGSSFVTAMSRNGVNFGIRMSGTGNQWFSAPAPVVNGLYFPGFTPEHANPDMGDSSITETAGIGGFAMAAAPAIVRFVGGKYADALHYSREMNDITLTTNNDFALPPLDFAGTASCIDARAVVESGILPVINTGIAHKKPGIGQIGAGICRAPYSVFQDGVNALHSRLSQKVPSSSGARRFSSMAASRTQHVRSFMALALRMLRRH